MWWKRSPGVLACALASAAALAWAAEPQEEFEKLFGDECRRVAATASRLDDVELARRLLALVKASRLNPATAALLCEKACELAEGSSAGQSVALEALDRLRQTRPGNRLVWAEKQARLREEQLEATYGAGKRSYGQLAAELWTEVADGKAAAGGYDAAVEHYERALVKARYYHPAMYKEIAAKLDEARFQRATQARIAELEAALKRSPDAADTRLELVRILLIDLDDPRRAADRLAPQDDSEMARSARLAARGTAGLTPAQSLELAQWYASLAEGASKRGKPLMLLRAKGYYVRYLDLHTVEDLARAKAKLELRRIDDTLAELLGTDAPSPATGGKPIDLLAHVRLSRDRIKGEWSLEKGILRVHPCAASGSRVTLPVAPRGDYQLLLDVRRFAGDDSCNIGLPVGPTHVTLIVDGERGTMIGLGDINGVKYFDGPAARKLGVLRDGKLHRIAVQVQTRSDRAQIAVKIDGKAATEWTGAVSALSPDKGVVPARPEALLLGSTRTGYEFHSVQLRMLMGKAEHLHKP